MRLDDEANGMALHPCLECGACCAKFRVEFYWREGERGEIARPVPAELFDEAGAFLRTMKGTGEHGKIRCAALKGKIGERVGCSIYEQRPSPCRAFSASFEDGRKNSRCDEARAAYGMRPLRREDWPEPPPAEHSVDSGQPFYEHGLPK